MQDLEDFGRIDNFQEKSNLPAWKIDDKYSKNFKFLKFLFFCLKKERVYFVQFVIYYIMSRNNY